MRSFDYKKYKSRLWDNEILNYLTQIHEFKGKQELFLQQRPLEMEKLTEVAKIQSIESSNRIEGIVTTSTRIGQIAKEKTTPRNRDEKEIAGYRDVLNTIHENHDFMPLNGNVILQLHRDLMQYAGTGNGGRFKITQNYLREIRADGSAVIRFTPVPPYETEPCITAICDSYREAMEEMSVDPLLVIPIFLHDFLCIHPFNDGNGRMSRLLTLFLLYRSGYLVGKYISLEKHIERTKDAYYDALEASSYRWHEAEEDPIIFVKYMLGVILACYREFELRMNLVNDSTVVSVREDGTRRITTVKNKAYDIVKESVSMKIGKFTKRQIAEICPSISEKSVELALKTLMTQGYIKKHGAGKNTFYSKLY